MSYEHMHMMEDVLENVTITGNFGGIVAIASYVFCALALYTIAQRREIKKAWLAWVPVLNVWILGSISDQYRYVVKGEEKSKRKTLLILKVISALITVLIVIAAVFMVVEIAEGMIFDLNEDDILEDILGPVLCIVGLALPLAGVSLAYAIIRYMALYDLYTSCDPHYNVLFLVLSILFGVTEPFFLFFSRNKDEGMPPRRQEPQYIPPEQSWQYDYAEQPPQQNWEEE